MRDFGEISLMPTSETSHCMAINSAAHLQTSHNSKSSRAHTTQHLIIAGCFRSKWISRSPKTQAEENDTKCGREVQWISCLLCDSDDQKAWKSAIAFSGLDSARLERTFERFPLTCIDILPHTNRTNKISKESNLTRYAASFCSCQSLKSLVTEKNVVRNH